MARAHMIQPLVRVVEYDAYAVSMSLELCLLLFYCTNIYENYGVCAYVS